MRRISGSAGEHPKGTGSAPWLWLAPRYAGPWNEPAHGKTFLTPALRHSRAACGICRPGPRPVDPVGRRGRRRRPYLADARAAGGAGRRPGRLRRGLDGPSVALGLRPGSMLSGGGPAGSALVRSRSSSRPSAMAQTSPKAPHPPRNSPSAPTCELPLVRWVLRRLRARGGRRTASESGPARGRGPGLARGPRIPELGAARDTGGHSGLAVGDHLAGEVIVHFPSPIPTMRRPVSTGCPQHHRTTPSRSVTPQTPSLSPCRHPTTRQITPPTTNEKTAEANAVSRRLGTGTIPRCREADRNTVGWIIDRYPRARRC